MVNAQKYINKNFSREGRSQIKNLSIRGKELEGHLDLNDFINLESIDCAWNKLTSLDLSELGKLKEIRCNDNWIEELDYPFLDNDTSKLTLLNISDNNLHSQDLSAFRKLVNLELLWVGSDDKEKIQQGVYNRFYGSLEPLKNLTKLVSIQINNTDIDSGVEFLPRNVEVVHYSTTKRSESKLKKITGELDNFLEKKEEKNWKELHPQFDKLDKREWERLGFSYQEAKDWIESGIHPSDYHFVAWLRWKGYKPQQRLDWEELRRENRSTQEWLYQEYPTKEIKETINWINITKNGLEGDLVVEDFPNLARLDCSYNQLSTLTLNNLPKLTYLYASYNKLSSVKIVNCPEVFFFDVGENLLTQLDFLNELNVDELNFLYVSNNKFPEQEIEDFGKFVNLKQLWLRDNNFTGSLKSLKDLSKLEYLNISNTKINEGFEYLSSTLKEVSSVHSRGLQEEDTGNFKIVTYTGGKRKGRSSEYDPAAYYDFEFWKSNQPLFIWLKEELKKISPNLEYSDILNYLADNNIFFNIKDGTGTYKDAKVLFSFFKQSIMLDQKDEKIRLLEARVRELNDLTKLVEAQKEKIIDAYLYFSPAKSKDLLRKLIEIQLEFTKFEKQESSSDDYEERYSKYQMKCIEFKEKLRSELESKTKRETMNEVQNILADCKELVEWELELKKIKSGNELKMIEYSEQEKITEIDEDLPVYKKIDLPRILNSLDILDNQLDELIKKAKNKIKSYIEERKNIEHKNYVHLMQDLLDSQRSLTTYQFSSPKNKEKVEWEVARLEEIKKELSHIIKKRELDVICHVKEEVVKLELQSERDKYLQSQIEIYSK